MTKGSHVSVTDSEIGSELRYGRAGKLGAILCPTACALILTCIFAISFIGTKLAYDQYCNKQQFDVRKLYIFPNFTLEIIPITNDTTK